MKKFFCIPFICAAFFSCKLDAQREDFTVPKELLGKWVIKNRENKHTVIVEITNTTIITAGISFVLQDVKSTNYYGSQKPPKLARQDGTIKTGRPGKPGVFCQYSITFGTKTLLELTGQIDGSTIFYGTLSQPLEKFD